MKVLLIIIQIILQFKTINGVNSYEKINKVSNRIFINFYLRFYLKFL